MKNEFDDMVDRAAREIWNDRDARMGGTWESRDPREVCVIQTRATARAALVAALTRPDAEPAFDMTAQAIYAALFEPETSDAYDNLYGALIDIERLSEQGKPTDAVCIRTIRRVLAQLNAVHSILATVTPRSQPGDQKFERELADATKDVTAFVRPDAEPTFDRSAEPDHLPRCDCGHLFEICDAPLCRKF